MRDGLDIGRAELPEVSSAGEHSAAFGGHASPVTPDAAASTLPWSRVGDTRWEIRGELGSGGMGRVLLARDLLLERDAAIKEPRTNADTERLRHEAVITARIEHPGVLPVYDAGLSPAGQPWFAMRLVRGTSLADALRTDSTAAPHGYLRPMLTVCETLAFAHERGIVHHDLKPANIMLGAFGEALVIDWGLALSVADAVVAPGAGLGGPTAIGTVRYMSPEQARGEPASPRDDVFSLGLILFECLSGQPAFVDDAPASILERLRNSDVPDLSARASSSPLELRAIIARATARDVAQRYADAKGLATDLANHLDGARVSAHQYTASELFARLVRAWKAPIAVALVAFVVIVVVVLVGVGRLRDERDIANDSLAYALSTAAERALFVDARAEAEILAAHSFAREPLPENRGVLSQLATVRPNIERLGPLACDPLDIFDDLLLCRTEGSLALMRDLDELWRMPLDIDTEVAFLSHGRRIAFVNRREVRVLDTLTRAPLFGPVKPPTYSLLNQGADQRSIMLTTPILAVRIREDGLAIIEGTPCGHDGFTATALHPDGDGWVAACDDGSITSGSFASAQIHQIAPAQPNGQLQVTALAFVPGRPLLLLGTTQGAVLTRHLESGEVTLVAAGEGLVHGIAVDDTGERAIVERDLGAPLVIDIASKATLGRLPKNLGATIAAFRPDGTLRVAGKHLESWDYRGVLPRAIRFADGIVTISSSADGTMLAIAHGPELTVVHTESKTLIGHRRWTGWMVKDVAFAPDGASLIAYGFGESNVLTMSIGPDLPVLARVPSRASIRRLALLANGAIVRSSASEGVGVHAGGAQDVWHMLLPQMARDLVTSPDGRHLAALGEDRSLYVGHDLNRAELEPPHACAHEAGAIAVAIDPEGTALFVAQPESVLTRCASGDEAVTYHAAGAQLQAVAASRRWIVAGARDGALWLWRRGEHGVYLIARPHEARVSQVVIDPAERWIASGAWDGRVCFLTLPPPERIDPAVVEAAWGLRLPEVMLQFAPTRAVER